MRDQDGGSAAPLAAALAEVLAKFAPASGSPARSPSSTAAAAGASSPSPGKKGGWWRRAKRQEQREDDVQRLISAIEAVLGNSRKAGQKPWTIEHLIKQIQAALQPFLRPPAAATATTPAKETGGSATVTQPKPAAGADDSPEPGWVDVVRGRRAK